MQKYLVLLFFLVPPIGFGQTVKIDSLRNMLQGVLADTLKAKVLSDITYSFQYENIDSAIYYARSYMSFTKDQPHLEKYYIDSYNGLGNAFSGKSEFDSAYVYLRKGINMAADYPKIRSSAYSGLGVMFRRKGELQKAIETYLEGVRADEKADFKYGVFIKYCNIGNLFNQLEDFDKSIEYNNKALKLAEGIEDTRVDFVLGTLLNNIGLSHYFKNDIDESLKYIQRSLEHNLRIENKREVARNYHNIGEMLSEKKEYAKAVSNLLKALDLRKEFKDKQELVETNKSLGMVYTKLGEPTNAKNYFDKALLTAKEIGNTQLISDTNLALSEYYKSVNDHKNALGFYKEHILLKDSISKNEKVETIRELELQYQTEKKDKELAEQNLQLEKQRSELQKKKSQYTLMTGFAIFLFLTSLLIWFLYQQRQKRKNQEIVALKREQQVKTLESLMAGEEKERLRIAKELHDGVNVDLSAIKYKLTSLLEKNNEVLDEVVSMIDRSCEQVRAISHNLVPPALKDFSLVEALQDYCATVNTIHKPEVSFQYIGETIQIEKKVEVNIFRIVQELVNNSIKHADATEIDVQISQRDTLIQITVEDNGKGFDKNKLENSGIGLQNIQSRVDYLNATLDVNSSNEGTSYIIDINTEKLI